MGEKKKKRGGKGTMPPHLHFTRRDGKKEKELHERMMGEKEGKRERKRWPSGVRFFSFSAAEKERENTTGKRKG